MTPAALTLPSPEGEEEKFKDTWILHLTCVLFTVS